MEEVLKAGVGHFGISDSGRTQKTYINQDFPHYLFTGAVISMVDSPVVTVSRMCNPDALAREMACVRSVFQWIIAKFAKRPVRSKPMLDILRLPMTKETLAKMTPEERSLFLLLGYASNQVNALWKLVIIATNHTPNDPVEQRVSGAQTQIFVRLTIGAMWEAWLLV